MSFSLAILLTIVASIVAAIDGQRRFASKKGGRVIGIIELVLALLLLISVFFALPISSSIIAIVLLLTMIIGLIFRGSVKGLPWLTIAAIILVALVVVLDQGWVTLPGF
jgi:uncharacterized membrane protein